jgi:hypothetical protein
MNEADFKNIPPSFWFVQAPTPMQLYFYIFIFRIWYASESHGMVLLAIYSTGSARTAGLRHVFSVYTSKTIEEITTSYRNISTSRTLLSEMTCLVLNSTQITLQVL